MDTNTVLEMQQIRKLYLPEVLFFSFPPPTQVGFMESIILKEEIDI